MAGFSSPLLPLGIGAQSFVAQCGCRSMLAFWMGGACMDGGVTPTPEPDEPRDSGAGHKKKRKPPPRMRLKDGTNYQPADWQEFNRLLAAVEYRTGEPPYLPISKAKPVKVQLTKPELAESYRDYLVEFIAPMEARLSDQYLADMEFRLGIVIEKIEERLRYDDAALRILLLLS